MLLWYFGKSEVWILIVFSLGVFKIFFGKNCLKVVVIIKFGVKLIIFFILGEFEIFFGCKINKLCFKVVFLIGVGVIIFFWLIGWFGCVIIVWML